MDDHATARSGYHHGNLKEALLESARKILEESGHSALSLRQCAKAVGVSATAPQNHFGNKSGLLTALATQGYAELVARMRSSLPPDASRAERRSAALQGYVAFALENPALYELMFARDRVLADDPALLEQVGACFAVLADTSQELGLFPSGDPNLEAREQVFVWSLVHGYAQLATAGRFKKEAMKGMDILSIFPEGNQTG
ncbi:TetR/AcrR family transcriptional regulator [Hyphobacterium indicum]|uniref:TetR/AcrR family transcriptional regulator n=1 Tax=Hyphobacterium indicum TaxID=2162714 RepID=UPI001374EAFC|nr:TetR/AcrR family transcriptional regulator [Hyphobacterium indicum]